MTWVYALLTALCLMLPEALGLAQVLPPDQKPIPPLALQSELKLTGHVTDPGGRLSPYERSELDKKIADLQTELHTDLPVFLVQELKEGETLETVAQRSFRSLKIGIGWDTGALLIISPDNKAHLQTGPGVGAPVTAEEAGQIMSEFAPAVAEGGLRGAIEHTLDFVAEKLRAVDGLEPRAPGVPNTKYRVHFYSAFVAMLGLLLLATFWRRKRAKAEPNARPVAAASSVLLDGLHRLTGFPKKRPAWFDVATMTGVAATLRMCWLSQPEGAHIFDESYYIQAARVILGLPVKTHNLPQQTLSFLDPNREHPPLAKLFIALGMDVLGDNAWGQRIASVVFGTACIPLLYLIVRRLGGKHGVAMIAAYLLALENLTFIHGRIATLDIFYVFFMLCAVYAYAAGLLELAGIALALSTNCKIAGLFGFSVLIGFEMAKAGVDLLKTRRFAADPWKNLAVLSIWYVGGTLIILGALDATWTRFATPVAHLKHILQFGANLTREIPQGIESKPLQWMFNEVQVPYIQMRQPIGDGLKLIVDFRGAMNPYILFFAPVALIYAAARGIRRRDELSLLAVALFLGTYAPYWYIYLKSARICYIYYFLPTIPALAIANALLVQTLRPRIIGTAYLATVAFGTWAYFPFLAIP